MRRRILDVTAYTTLDFADAEAVGPDWSNDATAVVDVTTPDNDSGRVEMSLELDPSDLATLDHHADIVNLTPGEARTLAADLEDAADRVDATKD